MGRVWLDRDDDKYTPTRKEKWMMAAIPALFILGLVLEATLFPQ